VAPSVSASVNLLLHHKVQKFSSGTGSPGWSRKMGRKTVVVVWCGGGFATLYNAQSGNGKGQFLEPKGPHEASCMVMS